MRLGNETNIMARIRIAAAFLPVAFALLLSGCSKPPSYGIVAGQVMVNGKPAEKIRVEFHPDAANGTTGTSSSAITDAEGRYTLEYHAENGPGKGAVVGTHKVVLHDLKMAESETGHGIRVRIAPEYGSLLTTPLERTVVAGVQTIDITVEPK